MANEPKKPKKPKGKNAFQNKKELECRIHRMITLLKNFREEIGKVIDPKDKVLNESKKKYRSSVKGVRPRLEFKSHGLDYYIDFTVVPVRASDKSDLEGCIIYGVSRTLCFLLQQDPPNPNDPEQCKECHYRKADVCVDCQRTSRCDGFEDKSLISFSVNKNGLIRSSGELEGEWWVSDTGPIEKLADLHYRALDHIWQDALDWTNENILP